MDSEAILEHRRAVWLVVVAFRFSYEEYVGDAFCWGHGAKETGCVLKHSWLAQKTGKNHYVHTTIRFKDEIPGSRPLAVVGLPSVGRRSTPSRASSTRAQLPRFYRTFKSFCNSEVDGNTVFGTGGKRETSNVRYN